MINIHSGFCALMPADQLSKDVKQLDKDYPCIKDCHIYLICKAPRVTINPAIFSIEGNLTRGVLERKFNGKLSSIPFQFPLSIHPSYKTQLNLSTVQVSNYPHRTLEAQDISGEKFYWPAIYIARHMLKSMPTLCDFEVLYVGQSFGSNGNRNAIHRLKSHSTLQKILADVHSSHPDDEVFLSLFAYKPYVNHYYMDGLNNDAEIKGEEDLDRLADINSRPLSIREQISLAEAGLIKYFQPHYNEVYKEKFPNESQKLLKNCYNLDISALSVEIDTTEIESRLYSQNAPPKNHHIIKIDLHDTSKRRSFFDFSPKSGK